MGWFGRKSRDLSVGRLVGPGQLACSKEKEKEKERRVAPKVILFALHGSELFPGSRPQHKQFFHLAFMICSQGFVLYCGLPEVTLFWTSCHPYSTNIREHVKSQDAVV